MPGVTALLLGETLLRAIAGPFVEDDPRPELFRQGLGAIGGAGIHHDQIVGGDHLCHRVDHVGAE